MEGMQRWVVVVGLCAMVFGSACHEDETVVGIDEFVSSCEDNASLFASDENWARWVEARAAAQLSTDPCQAPQWETPAEGAAVSISRPPTVAWTMPGSCAGWWKGLGPASRPGGILARVPGWLWPVSAAQAHCPSFSGENVLVEWRLEGETQVRYAALLSVRSYVPDAARWKSAWAGLAGRRVHVSLERALFVRGTIDAGPFASTPRTFVLTD